MYHETARKDRPMVITATQLKHNMGHYLTQAQTQDVLVTRNGKIVARISNPTLNKTEILDSLVGIAADTDMTANQAKSERLARQ
jgi:hypothetical protein